MLLRVLHETRYEYEAPVKNAQHMAHLKPAHGARQRLLSHRLAIDPAPARQTEAQDVFGNCRTFFSLPITHQGLAVVAESLVDTAPAPALDNPIGWEQARERMRYHREAVYDPATEFVFASPYVTRHENFVEYALPSFAPGRPLLEAAHDLMRRIHTDFDYEPEATDISTPVLQALAMRKGVCQDFAHVMLACLRSLGLPGRYVSGYLLTEPPPGQARLLGADASHAWVSLYVPGAQGPGHWTDLDPTNNRVAGEDYVTLAVGRDYSDISPVRGVIHGGGRHTLHVGVTVVPVTEEHQEQPA